MNYKKGNVAIAASIVVAGLIVAGAVMFTNNSSAPTVGNGGSGEGQAAGSGDSKVANVRPVDDSDWVYGSRDAEVTIVEYSDTECPFCSRVHPTLKQIVDEYDGKVNWVYRHFPLIQLHPIAPTVANATECVGSLGGNDAFWTFTNKVYEQAGANGKTDLSALPNYAQEAGVNVDEFNTCVEDSRFSKEVQEDYENAVASGGTGTPYSIVISGDQTIAVPGAQPIANWKAVIDPLLE
jgi:protein-disulfide isomerase